MTEEPFDRYEQALDAGMLVAEMKALMFEALWKRISGHVTQVSDKKREALRRQLREVVASLDESYFMISSDRMMTRKDLESHLAKLMTDPHKIQRLKDEVNSRMSAQDSKLTDYL